MYKSIILTLLSVCSIQAYGKYDKCNHHNKMEIKGAFVGKKVLACMNFDPENPEMCPMRLHYPRKPMYNKCKWFAHFEQKGLVADLDECKSEDQLEQIKEAYEKKKWKCTMQEMDEEISEDSFINMLK